MSQAPASWHITAKNGDSLLQNLSGDSSTDIHRETLSGLSPACVLRTELISAFARKKDGASFSRDDLENQLQQLLLQLPEVANSVHNAAYLEQGIQITCDARCWGQFAQKAIRVKVNHIPGMDDGGLGIETAILKFNPARSKRMVAFLEKKKKRRFADGDLISVMQPMLFDGRAIYQRGVAAFQVSNLKTSVFLPQ